MPASRSPLISCLDVVHQLAIARACTSSQQEENVASSVGSSPEPSRSSFGQEKQLPSDHTPRPPSDNATHYQAVDSMTKLGVSFLQVKQFAALVKPALKGILTPLIKVFAGTLFDSLGGALGSTMGQYLESGFVDIIPVQLGRSLVPAVSRVLAPTLVGNETYSQCVPRVLTCLLALLRDTPSRS